MDRAESEAAGAGRPAGVTRERARTVDPAGVAELRSREFATLSVGDGLTRLPGAASIERWLATVLPTLRPGEEQLAVAEVDVDGMAEINEVHGRRVGDEVLRRLAEGLVTTGGPADLHGRLGGDRFTVASVLPAGEPALSGWSGVLRAAALVRVQELQVRATVGVARVTDPATTVSEALGLASAATRCLRRARRGEPLDRLTGPPAEPLRLGGPWRALSAG